MLELDDQQQAARDWFESLRDRICAAFEKIEREAGSKASFTYTAWDRADASGEAGGGGVRRVGRMGNNRLTRSGRPRSRLARMTASKKRRPHTGWVKTWVRLTSSCQIVNWCR